MPGRFLSLCRDAPGPPLPSRGAILAVAAATAAVGLALATTAVRGHTNVRRPAGAALESSMLRDAEDERFDEFTRFEALLIAGGVSDAEQLVRLGRMVDALAAEVPAADAAHHDSLLSWAQSVHRLLHRRVLTGDFEDDAGDVRATLLEGDYNCLTATILFNELCRRRDVEVEAMNVPGHVFARIHFPPGTGDGSIDVQTTTADWRSAARPSPDKSSAERSLGDTELLAKVYYNRGVRLHRRGQFAAAVESLRVACRFDPRDAAARQNLAAAMNNWALAECAAGQFARAAALLADAGRDAPSSAPLAENDVYVSCRWAEALCTEGRYDEALDVLRAAQQRRPHVALLDKAVRRVRAVRDRNRPLTRAPSAGKDADFAA